jgi:DMSO/TMAO reductase YedYZ molybdopterin-dependent catalytic subunit
MMSREWPVTANRLRRALRGAFTCVAMAIVAAGSTGAQAPSAQAPSAPPAPAAPSAQSASAAAASTANTLVVGGDVATPLSLTTAEIKAMPRTKVEVKDEGRTVVYEGVLVGEILTRAGAPLGAALRGDAIASYVLARAADGYQVVFSLAELDPAFTSNDIIVADTIDGKPLFAYQGALRIVAPKDARGARSIRMLQRLEVVRLKK